MHSCSNHEQNRKFDHNQTVSDIFQFTRTAAALVNTRRTVEVSNQEDYSCTRSRPEVQHGLRKWGQLGIYVVSNRPNNIRSTTHQIYLHAQRAVPYIKYALSFDNVQSSRRIYAIIAWNRQVERPVETLPHILSTFNASFPCFPRTLAHLCSLEVLLDEVEGDETRLFRLFEVLPQHRLYRLGRLHYVIVWHLSEKGHAKEVCF